VVSVQVKMVMAMQRKIAMISWAFSFLCACGGAQTPVEEPTGNKDNAAEKASDESAEAPEKEGDESAASSEAADTKADEKPVEEAKSDSTLSRTPKDLLTAPDVLFMLSFNESEVGEKAAKHCDEASGDNPKKRAQCMTAEKAKVKIDGVAFKQEHGVWYFLAIRRKGSTLTNMRKFPIEFGEEKGTTITLKPTGKDKGAAPQPVPSKIVVETPNEYQIVLTDPKFGRMVYEAKIGLTAKE
jgi:hypothetical protein